MQAKKAKKPSQSIRYLLFVDKTLRKISLRKIRERVTTMKRPARARLISARVRSRKSGFLPLATSPRAIVLGVAGVLIAAAFLTARQPSPTADETTSLAPSIGSVGDQGSISPATSQSKTITSSPKPAGRAVVSKPRPTAAAATASPATPPAKTETIAKRVAPVPAASPTSAAADVSGTDDSPDTASAAVSTITGCVESEDGSFWLTDTAGADAPKSRSWKSGFFKKRSVRVEILDPSRTLHLGSYIGQRVTATGPLVDREMRARSLRRISGSCD